MSHLGSVNPWKSMWGSPRKTIRAIIDTHPNYGLLYLVSIFAFQDLLYYANWWSFGTKYSSLAIVIGALILSPFMGMIWVYFAGWIFHFTGRVLSGHAPASHLRAALAWSKIPTVINLAVWILYLVFSAHPFILEGSRDPGIFNSILLNVINLMTGIWSFILLVQSIREAQHFSTGQSVINVVMGWVIYFIFFVLLSGLARYLYLLLA